jgi:serine-type D-Ala-D-Ala endopeptidase (penicillin-binding protein 7)
MKYLFILLFVSINAFAQPSILYYDIGSQKYLQNNNINQTRPIASITKLMTAMVVLDSTPNLQEKLCLSKKVKSSLPRQQYRRIDLLNAMLVKSDNGAAETLADNYPGGRQKFIEEMNRHSFLLGMISTRFDDPTGLSSSNQSTAIDVATMVNRASEYDLIRAISVQKQVTIDAKYKKRIRKIVLPNTNTRILVEFDSVVVSKTGFTNPAGYCVAMFVEEKGQRRVIVVLGANNKNDRIKKVERIFYNI